MDDSSSEVSGIGAKACGNCNTSKEVGNATICALLGMVHEAKIQAAKSRNLDKVSAYQRTEIKLAKDLKCTAGTRATATNK